MEVGIVVVDSTGQNSAGNNGEIRMLRDLVKVSTKDYIFISV